MNNKGFAISTMMYTILLMAIFIVLATLSLLKNRENTLRELNNRTLDEVNDVSNSTNYLCSLKAGTPFTLNSLYTCNVSNTEVYDFYYLSEDNDYVNLLMSTYLPFQSGTYTESINITNNSKTKYNYDNSNSPTGALYILKNVTDNWYYLDNSFDDDIDNIDYSSYKARLLSYDDIRNINNLSFVSDTITSTVKSGKTIYSVKDGSVVDSMMSDEYHIVPVIRVRKSDINA